MKVKSLTIDYTGLSTYRLCPKKFQNLYIARRSSLSPSDALTFGSCIHRALAVYHAGGSLGLVDVCDHNFKEFSDLSSTEYRIPHDCCRCRALSTFAEEAKKTHLANLSAETPRSIHHGLNLLWHYTRIYGPSHSTFIPTVNLDLKPNLELKLTVPLCHIGDTELSYRGTIDGVVTETASGLTVGLEHKTTYYLNEAFLNRARLNDQVTGYIYLLRESGIAPDLNTFVWNVLQTVTKKLQSSPGECFARTATRRTEEQIFDWKTNTLATCRRILHDIEGGFFETNMPDGCTSWNSMCAFADVCNAPSQEREGMLLSNYVENTWDGIEVTYV